MRKKFGTDGRKWFLMQKMLNFCNDHRGEVVVEAI